MGTKHSKVLGLGRIVDTDGLPRWLSDKESACQGGDVVRLIPRSRRSPGGGNGNLLQYSCLENPMNRGAGDEGATFHKIMKSRTPLSV